jgi:hypothetical protein
MAIRTALLASILGLTILMATPARAQRTGDHIVPAIEDVCDGDPFSFGLCNAYCEALDCEAPDPLGTPRACSNLLRNYMKKSGGIAPPCGCPCNFNVDDYIPLLLAHNPDYDIAGGTVDCDAVEPVGMTSPAFEFQVLGPPEGERQGFIYFWLLGGTSPSCNVFVYADDGEEIFELFPVSDFPPLGPADSMSLSASELGACQMTLNFLCPDDN